MHWIERLADERIREAMERGEFDRLPLSGKPLPPDSNAFVPEDLRIAYKILKDAGFLPPEMELQKEIVSLKDLLETVDSEGERRKLRRQIDELRLRLDPLLKR